MIGPKGIFKGASSPLERSWGLKGEVLTLNCIQKKGH